MRQQDHRAPPGTVEHAYGAHTVRGGEVAGFAQIGAGDHLSAAVVEQVDLEIDVSAVEDHVVVVALAERPIVWTDLAGRRRNYHCGRGQMIFVPGGQPSWWHSPAVSGPALHLHLRPDIFHVLTDGEPRSAPYPIVAQDDGLLRELAFALAATRTEGVAASPLLMDAAGVQMADRLSRIFASATLASPERRTQLAPWQLKLVTDLLTDDLTREPRLADLAAAVQLSPNYFCTTFRSTTGLPPHRWLAHQRIKQAQALLVGTDLSVSDIAPRVGYDDPSYFARLFKRMTGATPLAYRRERSG